jgi:hypothetical protein
MVLAVYRRLWRGTDRWRSRRAVWDGQGGRCRRVGLRKVEAKYGHEQGDDGNNCGEGRKDGDPALEPEVSDGAGKVACRAEKVTELPFAIEDLLRTLLLMFSKRVRNGGRRRRRGPFSWFGCPGCDELKHVVVVASCVVGECDNVSSNDMSIEADAEQLVAQFVQHANGTTMR